MPTLCSTCTLNPRVSSYMAFYDVASNIKPDPTSKKATSFLIAFITSAADLVSTNVPLSIKSKSLSVAEAPFCQRLHSVLFPGQPDSWIKVYRCTRTHSPRRRMA